MGFNTTVIVLNDGLSEIANDATFGQRLKDAVANTFVQRGNVNIPAGCHANSAAVIETHHADHTVLVAIGGNTGVRLASIYDRGRPNDHDSQVRLLEAFADSLGYKIKPKRK